ncbi:phosphotransferase [Tropicibacter sp. R15_0]|uniref:phosphotransferase enzyme family protein n=1 Tax=Tropicibacter sp. R15_0 TaxID=2821101 RepID=UPI001ADAA324|nr:phosphotransferase [Tropicibacter sp. R15_0]MBO9468215.1 phosphotransferase [Tropicibacter sp. R15_0]
MTTAEKALPLWGLEGAEVTLIAARENTVYRLDHPAGKFALRLHRAGYRTDAQLTAELDWMAWVSQSGLSVPTPRMSLSGSHLQIVDGIQVDVLGWLEGGTLDRSLPEMGAATRELTFETLGRNMAKLHIASDAWPAAGDSARPVWDANGLVGDAPLWDRFWDNPALSDGQRDLLLAFREKARSDLAALAPSLDYGLIHADLVPGNVMVQGPQLHLIDFDDGGFGFRLFEIATALLKNLTLPDFDTLKSSLISGYHAERQLDMTHLDLFLALRAVTYVGWNISRTNEDKSGARNARFIRDAEILATSYLECRSRCG